MSDGLSYVEKMKAQPIKLVIFDLDGTLLETVGDLAASCNAVLRSHSLPVHDYAAYRRFVGNGVRKLCERALPEELRSDDRIDRLRDEFVAYYTAHIDCHSYAYEGIDELLAELVARGVKIAVVSNKFQRGTELLVERFFANIPFVALFGNRPEVPLKPDPAADCEVLRLAGVTPDQALHVGDTASDIKAARAAGVGAVGVSWGFRTRDELIEAGAERVIDHPSELLALL